MSFPHSSRWVDVPEKAKSGRWIEVLGSLVVGCVISLWVCIAQKVLVLSVADVAFVHFSFPVPWISQDHSQFHYADFPESWGCSSAESRQHRFLLTTAGLVSSSMC